MAIRGAIGPSSGAAAALVFADEPDALIRSDPKTIASVVVRGRSLTAATRAGEVEIEGSMRAVNRLLPAIWSTISFRSCTSRGSPVSWN